MKLSRILFCVTTKMKTPFRLAENEISINAPWGKIAALTWGSPTNPPVILCHGKLDACSGFRPLVKLLPDSFFYVSIDLPGNGRSDHLPRGVRYSVIDLVPTIARVMDHFKWDQFIYIGHSLGVPIGKFFNIAFPGHITRMVELDPVPAYHNWPCTHDDLQRWYKEYYSYYEEDNYKKLNGGPETAPVYSYELARKRIMHQRGLTEEAVETVLERCLVPTANGLYKLTFDQRMKDVTTLPFSPEYLRKIYTASTTPTFCILAKGMVDLGLYKEVEFVMDEKAWPNNNYKYKIVEGGHDVHINDPEIMADDIAKFLVAEKSKL